MTRLRSSSRLPGWRVGLLACALLSLCWAFGAAPAHAQKSRGKIAILGLEVEDKSGAPITEEATKVAKDLTRALRARADIPPSPYLLAPSSDKELIDEKLMKGCNDEAAACMSKIAEDLKAEHLLWGKIEKGKSGRDEGYKVSLTLLKIATKTTTTYAGFLPLSQKNDAGIKTLAKDAYTALTKHESAGTLVIKTNIEEGTILVDGSPAGNITNSRGEASIPEGSHKVAVSAVGYKTREIEVSVDAGKSLTREIELEQLDTLTDRGGTVSARKSYTGWKVAAGAGFAIAAGGTAWLLSLNYGPIADYKDIKGANEGGPGGALGVNGEALGSDNCDQKDTATDMNNGESVKKFKAACSAYRNTWIAGGVIGVGAIVGFGSLFYVLTRDSSTTERSAGRRTKRRPNIAITPIVSPTVGGATFRIDW